MRPALQRSLDVALAGALVLIGFAEFTGIVPGSHFPAPHAVHPVFIVACAAPLAVRHRWPLGTLVAIGVVESVWQYGFYPADVQPPFEPFLGLVLAVYTAGAYSIGRTARAVAVVVALGTLTGIVAIALGESVGNEVPPMLILLVTFTLGRAVAGYRTRADVERERAERLAREHEEQRRRAVADERARIARELHDVISHDVSLMVLQAAVERRVLAGDRSATAETLANIESAGRDALSELRRMLGVLRKSDDESPRSPQPGLAQLPDLVSQAREAGLDVRLSVEGQPAPLSAGLDLTAYRIVQESLTNVAKHAAGAGVVATVRFGETCLEVDVVDDGAGAPAELPSGGHGLIGMRERVALYGGVLHAGQQPGGGFRVTARLPVESPA